MARTKKYIQNGAFDDVEKLNNSSNRKSVMKRIIEAIKSLSEEDKDFESEPINKGEQAYFNACLANIKHPIDYKKDAEEYRNSLKASRAKKKELNHEREKDDLEKEIGEI